MTGNSKIREYVQSLLIAAIIAFFVRSFVVEAFTIPSGSMEPTLLVGDYLLVNRLSYVVKVPFTDMVLFKLGEPDRGDTIVFRYPMDHSKDFIKRVIAKEGDTVEIRNKVVYVNGKKIYDRNARFSDATIIPRFLSQRDNFGPVRVPKGCYFAMGDNRDYSLDSRFWGFVRSDELVGKALVLYFSRDHESQDLAHSVRWDRIARLVH